MAFSSYACAWWLIPTCSVHCVIFGGHLRARSEVPWLQTFLCFAGPLGALLLGTILEDPTVSVTCPRAPNPWECRAVFRHSQGEFFSALLRAKANTGKPTSYPPWGRSYFCCSLTGYVLFWGVLSFLGVPDLTFLLVQTPSFVPVSHMLPPQGYPALRFLGSDLAPAEQGQLQPP